MMTKNIRLATRASKLALIQAEIVKSRLEQFLDKRTTVSIVPLTTQGDRDLTKPLHEIGGKGIFIKEIEQALLDDLADIAVHSLKDITTNLAKGLQLSGYLKPEGQRDVLVFKENDVTFDTLPEGALIATGSLRRKALLKYLRPDIQTLPIRGNVLTRLDKIKEMPVQGILLSEAGLIRLELTDLIQEALDPTRFIPAPGQGVIALQTRQGDEFAIDCCQAINDSHQELISTSDLHFLSHVGLDCKAPLGLYTTEEGDSLRMKLFLSNEKLTHFYLNEVDFPKKDRLRAIDELARNTLEWLKAHGH
ncbi:hydroxymethylbilane synthase [Legionella taurinensis]|uniref:Hydroxymethylbilane synthase n=2 Tax=Legionella taurinensis TaxID=70611 RepID=A0A3A5LMZ6_9GAMM|nr:hydroxymethylbilane synthase [Legionella taurinensis]MDX1838729.1 hydroxymethylbilane synthase [Legionella taurinensis]PUT38771.1 hydroxymethylbilane synthase [Legionella taurinensis]PUT40231.1 hydroxymethylbilane synthase [Legionella taurinensis]PUT42538.1 hydroxymethylbilane synthase [Legionella taurinensis]PUT45957.1 hydroxymethylbilane synthase [Legionella taurinensis]